MLTISLTSIPPRFDRLGPVLAALLGQSIACRVVLTLPECYRRFPGPVRPPAIPEGVRLNRCAVDHGPATKLIGALELGDADPILYCDDDWLYAPDWAKNLLAAATEGEAVAASSFHVGRLRREAAPGLDRVAQGFAGVLVRAGMFDETLRNVPNAGYAADDVWISGHLAARGVPVRDAPSARSLARPCPMPDAGLQASVVDGMTRAVAYRACADAVNARYGIWPRRKPGGGAAG